MSIRFSCFSSSLTTAKRGGRFSIYRASICVRSQRKQPRDGAVWFRFMDILPAGFSFCSVAKFHCGLLVLVHQKCPRAFIYFEDEPGRRRRQSCSPKMRRGGIAANVAKLPALLKGEG